MRRGGIEGFSRQSEDGSGPILNPESAIRVIGRVVSCAQSTLEIFTADSARFSVVRARAFRACGRKSFILSSACFMCVAELLAVAAVEARKVGLDRGC